MIHSVKVTFVVLSLLTLAGCTKDFVDINTNPNASIVASPQSLLAPTLVSVINGNLSRNARINNEFMQVTVTTADSREFHRYEVRPSESDYMWRRWYLELTNIRDIYANAEVTQQAGYQTFQGISLILDAWVGSLLTDMFGDIPYSESNLGRSNNNTTPKFDTQKEVYALVFTKLDSANSLLRNNVNFTSDVAATDPIYGGVADKWRRFGNSLFLRLLLRVAHKEPAAQAKIKQIVEDDPSKYPVFQNNDASAILKFTGVLPYQTEFSQARDFDFNGDKGYSEFFINNLVDLQDPRLPIWSTEATLGVYAGMQSGYAQGNIPDRQSTLQLALKNQPLLGNMMNYAELQFILAEAALKGYITGSPKTYYDNGVRSSISLWGPVVADSYFNNPKVQYDEAAGIEDQMKKIHLQKYFAMIFTDFQQWYEYRRTRALDLYTGPGLLNDGRMPSRLNYPILVQTLNKANYDIAVQSMGGNSINEKVWWEK